MTDLVFPKMRILSNVEQFPASGTLLICQMLQFDKGTGKIQDWTTVTSTRYHQSTSSNPQ